MGTCRYLLSGVREGLGTAIRPWFAVEVQHRRAWDNHAAMTEHVWLHFHSMNEDGVDMGWTIYMKVHEPSRRPTHLATEVIRHENGTHSSFLVNEMRNDEFTMVNYGNRIEVTTWFGVHVEYAARDWTVDVHVPECYSDVLDGLCGNYNGDRNDEWTDRNGTLQTDVVMWAQSWQTAWDGEDCEGGPNNFDECTNQDVLDGCALVKDESGIFARCQDSGLQVETFYDNCVFDLCLDESVKCDKLGQFAQSCFRVLAGQMQNDEAMCDWATEIGCAPECGANSAYTGCADTCRDTRTCGNRHESVDNCPANGRFVSMCVCNEGFVLENGECILEALCGCLTTNGASVANGYVYEDCIERCMCSEGTYECSVHAEGTAIEGCVQGK